MEGFMKAKHKTSTREKPTDVRKHGSNPYILTCVSKSLCLNGLFPNISIIHELISEVIRNKSCHIDSCSLLKCYGSMSIVIRRTSYLKLSCCCIATMSLPVRA